MTVTASSSLWSSDQRATVKGDVIAMCIVVDATNKTAITWSRTKAGVATLLQLLIFVIWTSVRQESFSITCGPAQL
jgi:hypothetical protein